MIFMGMWVIVNWWVWPVPDFHFRKLEAMREAWGNEEREKREDEKGSHCFFKSSGYDKLELKYQNLVFSSLYNALLKCHGVKQMQN